MIYAEDVFLLNTVINYIILVLTGKIAKSQSAIWREILGACIGGVYAVLMFVPSLAWGYAWIGKLIFSCFIVFVVFGARRVREYFKTVMVFHFTTFAMAGATYGILSISGITSGKFPLKILLISIILSYIRITMITKHHSKKASLEKNIGELKIHLEGKEVSVNCLADTGNEAGVTIVEFEKVKTMFPDGFSKDFETEDDLELVSKYNLKIQPICSIGKGGMLLCFTATGASFNGLPIKNKIGLTKQKLSPTDMYHAITGGIA